MANETCAMDLICVLYEEKKKNMLLIWPVMRSSKETPVLEPEFQDHQQVHVQWRVHCQAQVAFLMCHVRYKPGSKSPDQGENSTA